MQHSRYDGAQHLRLSSVDACEEEEISQEKADGELQVECSAGILNGPAQEKSDGSQEQAQERKTQSHIGDHRECRKHSIVLQTKKDTLESTCSYGSYYQL